MIAWSIQTARRSGLFERIIVSTDSAEIAEVARSHGAETPFERPAAIADDHSGTLEVVAHAARWAESENLAADTICCIYATAPLLSPEDLSAGLAALDAGGWDYVLAAASFPQVFRAFLRQDNGAMEAVFPEHSLTRSQDLSPTFHDAGQFYWGRRQAWLESRPIYGPRTTFVELPPNRVRDIDTPDDWIMAERLFEILQRDEE